jgi:hypothetical protein
MGADVGAAERHKLIRNAQKVIFGIRNHASAGIAARADYRGAFIHIEFCERMEAASRSAPSKAVSSHRTPC